MVFGDCQRSLTGIDGHAFVILRELASVSPADGARVRVLYLVPELASTQYIVHLEARAFLMCFVPTTFTTSRKSQRFAR